MLKYAVIVLRRLTRIDNSLSSLLYHSRVDKSYVMPKNGKVRATLSNGVFYCCDDIEELIVSGLFESLKGSRHDAKSDYILPKFLRSIRLVSRAFRKHVDSNILKVMKDIGDLAQVAHSKLELFVEERNCAKDAGTFSRDVLLSSGLYTESRLISTWTSKKEMDRAHKELMSKLLDYFPVNVCEAYGAYFTARRDSRGLNLDMEAVYTASMMKHLHATVCNFMAMFCQTCYLHNGSGVSNRKNKALKMKGHGEDKPEDNFSCICLEKTNKVACVYSSVESVFSLSCSRSALSYHSKSYKFSPSDKKLHTDLMRLSSQMMCHCLVNPMEEDPTLGEKIMRAPCMKSRLLVCNLLFVLSHPDINVPSVEKMLQITTRDMHLVRSELARKNQQIDEFKVNLKELQYKALVEDVDAFISTRMENFASLEELEQVVPGQARFIKQSIRSNVHCFSNSSGAFSIRPVREGLKDIIHLFGTVRQKDKNLHGTMVASNAAYDFMTGKALNVLSDSCDFLHTSRSSAHMARIEDDCIVKSMHTFDDAVFEVKAMDFMRLGLVVTMRDGDGLIISRSYVNEKSIDNFFREHDDFLLKLTSLCESSIVQPSCISCIRAYWIEKKDVGLKRLNSKALVKIFETIFSSLVQSVNSRAFAFFMLQIGPREFAKQMCR